MANNCGMLSALLATTLAAPSFVTAPQDPPKPVETHYAVYIGGQPAGASTHRVTRIDHPDGPRWEVFESMVLNMGRMGQEAKIEQESTAVESADGEPIAVRGKARISRRDTITTVRFEDDVAYVETAVGDNRREFERELEHPLLGPHALDRRLAEVLDKPGHSFSAWSWSADSAQELESRYTVGAAESVAFLDGRTEELIPIEVQIAGMPMKLTVWFDARGEQRRTQTDVAGMQIVAERTTVEAAAAAAGAEVAPEVFTASMVVEPRNLPSPRWSSRAVVRLRASEGDPIEVIECDAQRRLGTTEAGVIWSLRSLTPPPGLRGALPVAIAERDRAAMAEFLDASAAIQCDAAPLIARSREVVAGATDAWQAAQRLERWVEQHVEQKGMDVGFATALEVFEERAGDCSEHAVLLCAGCRAVGIPSRVAMGFLYIGGIWAGHAWTEVWIDGAWYALDATVGNGFADAMRIKLLESSFADESSVTEFAGLLGALGRSQIEVLEISSAPGMETRGREGVVEDRHYHNALFGIGVPAPEGLELTATRPEKQVGFRLVEGRAEAGWRFELRAYDVGPEGGWPPFLGEVSGDPIEVDGRPGIDLTRRATRRVLVRAGHRVFEFVFRNVVGDAARRACDALLGGVDFDVR